MYIFYNVDGRSYAYSESLSFDTRTIVTNHCLNHPFYNLNPNTAIGADDTYVVPLNRQANPPASHVPQRKKRIDSFVRKPLPSLPRVGDTWGCLNDFPPRGCALSTRMCSMLTP